MLGLLVSRHLAYGPVGGVIVVAATVLLMRILHSPVAPALSAGYLPLALAIRDWSYPLAILIATTALALLGSLGRGRPPAQGAGPPAAVVPSVGLWLPPLALFLAGCLLLVRLVGSPLVLYPPLLVIAWETLAHPGPCRWRRRPASLLAATGAAALVGLLLARILGQGPLAVALAALLTALLLWRLRLHCPPAFAVALLPLVLPRTAPTFPLEVLLGGGWLVVVAGLTGRHRSPSAGE